MIVKILSSAKNFAGINYNERKNDLGKSELLKAENFDALSHNTNLVKADYINYMKAICALNPRVKNKQFHAVISAKGKNYAVDKLTQIGIQYLKKMGYADNPYLIYHHSDTNHTHIHLVSTRVDKHGQKVNDSFEKIRSQKVMHEILSLDPTYEADTCISKAMAYNFSTEAQFRLLLELKGFHLREKNEKTEVIKYGTMQGLVDPALIEKRIREFAPPRKRVNQLKALFHKYAIGLSEDQLSALMKEKFGLDIVFHRKGEHEKPYGYTVVDYAQKNVFKGSQIIRLSELLTIPSEDKIMDLVHELVNQPGLSFTDFQKELAKLGLNLNQQGAISWRLGVVPLPSDVIGKLRYAERLRIAYEFRINDFSCKVLLGRLLSVKPGDIATPVNPNKDFDAFRAVIVYLDQTHKWEEGLNHYGFQLMKNDHSVFLWSKTSPVLLHLESLLGKSLSVPMDRIPHVDTIVDQLMPDNQLSYASRESFLEALADIIAESQQVPREEKDKKRTRRPRQKSIKR